jgi:very-short-patch-repair endonuclease
MTQDLRFTEDKMAKWKTHPMLEKHHSEISKERMRQAKLGRHLSEEHKKNISEANKKVIHTKEWNKNVSNANKGQIPWLKGRTNVYSNETLEKMRQARLRRKEKLGYINSEETKRKIGLAQLGKKGKPLSEWHKQILIKSRLGTKHSEKARQKMKEQRAKQICPKIDTSIEIKIQNFLKELEIEFFTHQYMSEIKHSYQCDIFIPLINLIVECDGNFWHKYPIGKDIDKIRTNELIEKGFKVLRLWESEIKKMSLEDFKIKIFN